MAKTDVKPGQGRAQHTVKTVTTFRRTVQVQPTLVERLRKGGSTPSSRSQRSLLRGLFGK